MTKKYPGYPTTTTSSSDGQISRLATTLAAGLTFSSRRNRLAEDITEAIERLKSVHER